MISLDGVAKGFAVFASLGAALSGLVIVYQAVAKVGEERAEARRLRADFVALQQQAGDAIRTLNEQYAAQVLASNRRRKADELKTAEYRGIVESLEAALEEARETDDCIDKPVPLERAERVRELARQAGRRTLEHSN